MQNIFLSFDSFKHPEYFYLFIAFGLVLIAITFTIQKKRNKRVKLLNLLKLIIFLFLTLVISIPQKNVVLQGSQLSEFNKVIYIDASINRFQDCIEILKAKNPTMSVPIIIRFGKKYLTNINDIADLTDQILSESSNPTFSTNFMFFESDISIFCDDAFINELIVIGDSKLSKQQIDKGLQYCNTLEFKPLPPIVSKSELRIENIIIQTAKLNINQPITLKCLLNQQPKSSLKTKIKVDNDLKSTLVINNQDFTIEIDGIKDPGLHEINVEADGLSFSKFVLVNYPKKIFILKGNTKAEQQSDNFLMSYAKVSDIEASLLTEIPENLYNYNSGFIRLSQFLILNENDRKLLESWVANGAGLFISYGEDIQLWKNQLDEFKHFLPAEPVLLNEPEKTDNTSVEESDQDSLVARVSIMLMIDNSGSMAANIGGISRFEYVKAAAKKMIENLNPDDYVGICSFNSEVTIEMPLNPVRNKELIYRKIDNINSPGMQTSIRRACDSAIDQFSKDRSAVKQLIILSDGEETIETEYNFQITREKLIESEINTSVIGFGEYNPEMLASLVTKGGKFYFQSREKDSQGFYIHKLPEFIMADVKLAKDNLKNNFKSNTKKDDFTDTNKALPQVIKTGTFPSFWHFNVFGSNNIELKNIMRFVEMYNFNRSYTILGLNFNGIDFPLLSARNYQRGKILAFACDFSSEYVPDWFGWNEFHLFFMQLINFMNSQSFEGIEYFGSSFEIKDKQLIINSNLSVNNPEFMKNDFKVYAVDEKMQFIEPVSKNIVSEDQSNKVLKTSLNIDDAVISRNLVFEYKSRFFELIDIPESIRISKSEIPLNPMSESMEDLKFESKIRSSNAPQTEKQPNLTLITLLLMLTLLIYVLDVYLRR